jgi:hypothetical protein
MSTTTTDASTPGAALAPAPASLSGGQVTTDSPVKPSRTRRTYDVWERITVGDDRDRPDPMHAWVCIGTAIEAQSRTTARQKAANGRNGVFATTLDGEFVEETVHDPETRLVEEITRGIADILGPSHDLAEACHAVVLAAVKSANEESKS